MYCNTQLLVVVVAMKVKGMVAEAAKEVVKEGGRVMNVMKDNAVTTEVAQWTLHTVMTKIDTH